MIIGTGIDEVAVVSAAFATSAGVIVAAISKLMDGKLAKFRDELLRDFDKSYVRKDICEERHR